MPTPLPPDPDSVEKWQELPQNKPSKQALPPATGGFGLWGWFVILLAILVIVGLILGRPV